MPLIITAEEVAATLALSLNDSDVLKAQSVIEIVTGVDLASAGHADRFDDNDLRLLRDAVVWEVGYLNAHPDVLTAQSNITSASTNGSSVTFDTAVADGYLAPLAARVLAGLSWVQRGFRAQTLVVAPREDYEVRPSSWYRIR